VRSLEVETQAARLFVYEWGDVDAPTVLYWDGRRGTGLHANEIGPILAGEFGFRVIAPDPPGHGRSPAVDPERLRPSALAWITDVLLEALNVPRAAFIGFSWGARIACAFGARCPDRAAALVLVDGGYVDFVDLPDFDASAGLADRVEAARRGARAYTNLDSYFADERRAIGRWNDALAEAHAAMMRESHGHVVPIATPEVIGAIHHANCIEPTAAVHAALRGSGVPILLITPADSADANDAAGRAGLDRFGQEVPQLETRTLPTDSHDLVSHLPDELARAIGAWLRPLMPAHVSVAHSTR
jgi:pimeloyl-ACP methyl ester carboxylesterase